MNCPSSDIENPFGVDRMHNPITPCFTCIRGPEAQSNHLYCQDCGNVTAYRHYVSLSKEAIESQTVSQGEADPAGLLPNQPGAKLDSGKLKVALCILGFANALEAVAEVTTFGARKYTPNGWKEVPKGFDRYTDAMFRHLLKEETEGLYDEDSNLLHAAHVAWNALARLEFLLQADLPRKGPGNE